MDGLEMATAERTDLADLLATLTPDQWEAQSLCERWRVRDVVAHVMSFDGVSLLGMFGRVIRGRIIDANQVGRRTRIAQHRTAPRPAAGSAAAAGAGHDLRRPVRAARRHHPSSRHPPPARSAAPVPAERLRCVLGDSLHTPELPGWHLARGVRLTTTDLDWSHGRGPELTGPAEAVLMAVSGRQSAIGELAGPGQQVLARRLARRQRRTHDRARSRPR